MKFVLILVLSSHILELVLMKFVLILVLSSHILELVLMKFVLILVLSSHIRIGSHEVCAYLGAVFTH